jgi:S1-C subfamily serine protease
MASLALLLAASEDAPGQGPVLKYPVGMLGDFTRDGLLIRKVLPETPAQKAGLEAGDLVQKVDGRIITTQAEFVAVINSSGGSVVLQVKKGGAGRVVRIELDLAGTAKKGPVAPYFLGVIGNFTREGLQITGVGPGTPAARIGLEKGDTIVRIDNVPMTSEAVFFRVVYNSGGIVTLHVRKANERPARLEADMRTFELGVVGDFTREGMVLGIVAPATPAAVIGLQKGDVILRIDNQQVRNQGEFKKLINNSGGTVTLLVRRGMGRPTSVTVDLMNNQLGAWCEESSEGMRVTAVVPGSPADHIGLRRGDTIVKIDEVRVRSKPELFEALRNTRGLVTLLVRSGLTGRLTSIEVDLLR